MTTYAAGAKYVPPWLPRLANILVGFDPIAAADAQLALRELDTQERTIVFLRYAMGWPRVKVARALELPEHRVRHVEHKAVMRLPAV